MKNLPENLNILSRKVENIPNLATYQSTNYITHP